MQRAKRNRAALNNIRREDIKPMTPLRNGGNSFLGSNNRLAAADPAYS
jgi:hypothetical protein